METMDTVGDFYETHMREGKEFPEGEYFYGYLPRTFSEVLNQINHLPKIEVNSNRLNKLKTILEEYHKKLGLLTPKVQANINLIQNGVILGGQQTTIFGGSGILANKIATIATLSELSKEKDNFLVPMFLVNTHDSIQPEITSIHLPNNQSSHSKPIVLEEVTEGVIVNKIKTNNFDWLEENLQVIKNIFSEFKNSVEKNTQKLFMERVEHIITILRETYRTSADIGEWVTLIWGIQANIINDWGVIFFPSSHPEIRKLTARGYEPFLKKRQDYLEEFNKASEKIQSLGLRPTTAKKKENYSPFFYECPNDGYRLELSCTEDEDTLHFEGKCPLNNETYSFSTNKSNIDLGEHIPYLVPRLDTSQALLHSIMPIYVRVSGPGEINYNAQVIPAVTKIGIQFPLYVKYTRILYNTPWIENISKTLDPQSLSLFTGDFFKILGNVSKARRKKEGEALILSTNQLTENVKIKMKEIKEVQNKPQSEVERYKSWQFGMYDSNHKWQEVSWPWIIMAAVTGFSDYLASYKRYYSEQTPVGGIGYINSRL
ncbi:MAG: bacillithiol biosynthesis protein BshC [Candidatus Heimdallarchaeaceae archaeon]